MKIAISATAPNLDAEVEPRFGRCPYFIIVDPDTMQFEAVENSSAMASGGAGIASGQMIAGKGVSAVLTGNCGPNAYQVLSAAGITIITGVSGKVRDAVSAYKAGQLQNTSQPTVAAHFGMRAGSGPGQGGGMGRGKGMGMRTTDSFHGEAPAAPTADPEEELKALKEKLQSLSEQLSGIQRSIDELERKA
ncbi:MAG: NifB/NifX family molybdenum-iron cluster-binding protein [Dehalococcoidales bacterium]|nr:NifB/NifX family molybdenum-iron cluster-binding protein [Dehalococcoidales bacterium]